MKNILFPVLLVLLITGVYSQTVLLEKDVRADSVQSKWGPNRSNYINIYFGFGFFADPPVSDSAEIIYGKSNSYALSVRYKKKICEFWAVGLGLYYNAINYSLKQSIYKVIPNKFIHDKEQMNVQYIGMELYERLNFKRRGDIIGVYVDAGLYAGLRIYSWNKSVDKFKNRELSGAKKMEITYKKLTYLEKFEYGITARMGINRVALYGTYRLSNLFTDDYTQYPELPRLTIGVEVALIGNNPVFTSE
ncbi:MAG: PorT family protein [Bacteroidetes bacterium]|nr:PorT family protein [Bacteroidota bacterium]